MIKSTTDKAVAWCPNLRAAKKTWNWTLSEADRPASLGREGELVPGRNINRV
jgi:hypothetical protein